MKTKILTLSICMIALAGCFKTENQLGNKKYMDDDPKTERYSIHKKINARWKGCEQTNPNDMAPCMEPDQNSHFVKCLLKGWDTYLKDSNRGKFDDAYAKCEDTYTEAGHQAMAQAMAGK